MARYKLLAGQYQGPDPDAEPIINEATGKPMKPPTRTYLPGEVIETDIDLIARGGPGMFQLLAGQPKKKRLVENPRLHSFPAGQVHDGFQKTSNGPDGRAVSGPMSEDEAAELSDASDADTGDDGANDDDATATGATAESGRDYDAEYGNLSDKNVEELRSIAESEEIDLKGARVKADIINRIRQHGGG